MLLLLRLYCRGLNRPVFCDWIFGNILNHTAQLIAPNPPIRANGPDSGFIIDCRGDIRIGKFISRSVAGCCMDHFRNTVGPARRSGSARLTDSNVPLRTPHLQFILDSSVGIVTMPLAGDQGIGVQFSTPAEIVFPYSVQTKSLPHPSLCPVAMGRFVCGDERLG